VIANQRPRSLGAGAWVGPTVGPNRRPARPPLPADLLAPLATRGLLYLAALVDRRSSWRHEDYDERQARELFYRYLLAHPRLAGPLQTLYAEIVPEGAYLAINPRLWPLAACRAERRSRMAAPRAGAEAVPRLELVLDIPRPPHPDGRGLPEGYRTPSVENWAAKGNAAFQTAQAGHLALVTISY